MRGKKKHDSIYEQCQSYLCFRHCFLLFNFSSFCLSVPIKLIEVPRLLAVSRARFDYIYPLTDKHKRKGAL